MTKVNKKSISLLIFTILIPTLVILGSAIFKDKFYSFTILLVTIATILPAFFLYEHSKIGSKEITIIAVMVALSSAGRFIFYWFPGFKPVTAITIICGIYLGNEAGFMIGALSALISNFYFGQGPWTPFQMLSWGLIGLLAGLISKYIHSNKIMLCTFGALAGLFYSLTLDIWSTLWIDGYFNISRYVASVVSAIPTTIEYAISNIIFLLCLNKPLASKLNRITTKFGLFVNKPQ